jgi:hypothetical protein
MLKIKLPKTTHLSKLVKHGLLTVQLTMAYAG